MRNDPFNRFVASEIARHRVRRSIKVADLADGSGIPLGTVSNLLTGACRYSLINLHRVLCFLALPVGDIWPESQSPGQEVTEESILRDIEAAKAGLPKWLSVADVLEAAATVYGVSLGDLASPSRKRHLSQARAIAAHIVGEQPHLTTVSLSKALQRDVSGLFHVARRMEERLSYDRQLAERLDAVRRLLS